jgi:hypothetical protein
MRIFNVQSIGYLMLSLSKHEVGTAYRTPLTV